MLRRKRFWFGLVISLGFLAFFLYNTDFGEIIDAFEQADYLLAFASVPLYFVGFWIRTMRWQVLMNHVRRIRTIRLYPVVLVGLMVNNVMPARVGELARMWLIGEREKVSRSAALGTIAVDRVFDGLTLVAILAVVTIFAGTSAGIKTVGVGTAVVFFAAAAVLVGLAFSPQRARALALYLLNRMPHGFGEKIEDMLDNFLEGLQSVRSPSILLLAAGLSLASWSTEAFMYYVVGQAFHLDVGIHVYFLIAAGANLALSILASPGGVGPFEATTKTILLAFIADQHRSAVAAYAIGLHALLLAPVIVLGFVLLWSMQLSLGQLMGASEREPASVAVPRPAPVPPVVE